MASRVSLSALLSSGSETLRKQAIRFGNRTKAEHEEVFAEERGQRISHGVPGQWGRRLVDQYSLVSHEK